MHLPISEERKKNFDDYNSQTNDRFNSENFPNGL